MFFLLNVIVSMFVLMLSLMNISTRVCFEALPYEFTYVQLGFVLMLSLMNISTRVCFDTLPCKTIVYVMYMVCP